MVVRIVLFLFFLPLYVVSQTANTVSLSGTWNFAPHTFSIGVLMPGKHKIVLQIVYPIGNERSHSYGVETQTIWNGELGMEFSLKNRASKRQKIEIEAVLIDKSKGKAVKEMLFPFDVNAGDGIVKSSVKIKNFKTWDEFSPNLYTLECRLKGKYGIDTPEIITFGFRSITTNPNYIVVNGTPRFMRENLDCAVFSLTGDPATDKESWMKIS